MEARHRHPCAFATALLQGKSAPALEQGVEVSVRTEIAVDDVHLVCWLAIAQEDTGTVTEIACSNTSNEPVGSRSHGRGGGLRRADAALVEEEVEQ